MPNHLLADIHALIQADMWALGSRRCRNKVADLGYGREDVASMILSLTENEFDEVWPDAETDLGTIQADVYLLNHPSDGCIYYIKLGINASAGGQACVVASFHLSS